MTKRHISTEMAMELYIRMIQVFFFYTFWRLVSTKKSYILKETWLLSMYDLLVDTRRQKRVEISKSPDYTI